MEIIVEDVVSYIKDITRAPKALAIVREVCRARPEGYKFMSRYKRGVWDGYISLMHSTTKFPTGLLWFVVKRLEAEGFNIAYDMRSKFIDYDPAIITDDMLQGITLRDYQLDAISKLLRKRRGIAKMATNAGKTEVMAGIIKALNVPRTMVLVNRKELLYQTAKRFSDRLDINVGMIGDGVWQPDTVNVAMIQTLQSRLDGYWKDNQLLMVDECHHTSGNRTLDVVNSISGAYRFGFSGTPLKHEVLADLKLIAATGRIQVDVTNAQLIEQGYSAEPLVRISTIVEKDKDLQGADYQMAYKELIINNTKRNIVIAEQAKDAQGVVLIIVNQIIHGQILQDMIPGAVFVHGSDATDYRNSILEIMRAAKRGVFIASPIFDEGIDIPAIDTVILACGGKSHVKLLQRIGRGLRKKDNGNPLIVHDFVDDTNKYLYKHSERRIETYAAEGFKIIYN